MLFCNVFRYSQSGYAPYAFVYFLFSYWGKNEKELIRLFASCHYDFIGPNRKFKKL